MISYWGLLLKTTLRNRLNYLPLIVLIFLSLFLLLMNTRAKENTGVTGSINFQNESYDYLINEYSRDLQEEMSAQDFEKISEVKQDLLVKKAENEQSKKLFEKGGWRKALTIQLDLLDESIAEMSGDGNSSYPLEYQKAILGTRARYKYLVKNNLEPDSPGAETQGFPYVFSLMDVLFPIVVVSCLLPILTNLFNANFREGINIEWLFPMSRGKILGSKLIFASLLAYLCYLSLLLITFLTATLLNGSNAIHYPININTPTFTELVPIVDLLPPVIGLQLLCLVFVVLLTAIMADLTKNKVATMFASIGLLCGGVLSVMKIQPLQKILHLLPWTYFHTVSVLVKDSSVETGNSAIDFKHGFWVLLIWILVEIVLIFLFTRFPKKTMVTYFNQKNRKI